MSSANDFIAELIRAGKPINKLTAFERNRFLGYAATVAREMREQIGMPTTRTSATPRRVTSTRTAGLFGRLPSIWLMIQ
ncbi:hypothetical protein [Neorhizobium galegae]|uniref:hypothetical protein n=1 Tax=Neorhizobium galegae TaxID=399 RepID=UPI000627F5D6|nr:hypothetical protein [Neorhizobium galegae]